MVPKFCSTPECERIEKVRGMCRSHYAVAIRSGRIQKISKHEMFWSKVKKTGSCWEWTGTISQRGYGQFKMHGRAVPAHRHSFEIQIGPIAHGKQLDHRCHNRACVNPAHLREVTPKQNGEHRLPNKASKSGVRGVTWRRRQKKWVARVGHNGSYIQVGSFHDLAEAESAVIAKRNELFTHNDLDRIKN